MICLAAIAIAISPDEHCRSTVCPGTDIGNPAASDASRPMFIPAVPAVNTDPIITSSISAPSMPARSTAWRIACAVMVGDLMLFSDPLNATPIGVRAVETMTASFMNSWSAAS